MTDNDNAQVDGFAGRPRFGRPNTFSEIKIPESSSPLALGPVIDFLLDAFVPFEVRTAAEGCEYVDMPVRYAQAMKDLGIAPQSILIPARNNMGFDASVPFKKPVIRETLKPADQLVLDYLIANGSISAQEAFLNLKGMSSATLARRITTIIRAGHEVTRDRPRNPATKKLYTRYVLADFGTSAAGLMAGVNATVSRRLI